MNCCSILFSVLNITNFRHNFYTCTLTIVTSIDNHFLHLVNLIHAKTLIKAIVRYLCLGFAGFMGNYTFSLEISNTGQKRSTSRGRSRTGCHGQQSTKSLLANLKHLEYHLTQIFWRSIPQKLYGYQTIRLHVTQQNGATNTLCHHNLSFYAIRRIQLHYSILPAHHVPPLIWISLHVGDELDKKSKCNINPKFRHKT